MEIVKILNNNVALVMDDRGNERVVMGRGLAFHKRVGEQIDPERVEKTFALQNHDLLGRFGELLLEIPVEVLAASECIIALAREELGSALHESLAISLTDHINFALQRHRDNIPLRNVLRWEIRSLYPKEYAVGLAALEIIVKRLNVRLHEDEAGFIALHLVNAQLHSDMSEVLYITRFIQQVLNLVKDQLKIEYQHDSLSYNRFITHLKFFAQRMLAKRNLTGDDPSLYDVVQNRYPQAWRCVDKITAHIVKNYDYVPGTEERMFLTIHIEQLRKEARKRKEEESEDGQANR